MFSNRAMCCCAVVHFAIKFSDLPSLVYNKLSVDNLYINTTSPDNVLQDMREFKLVWTCQWTHLYVNVIVHYYPVPRVNEHICI
jgi:hypothetical protein